MKIQAWYFPVAVIAVAIIALATLIVADQHERADCERSGGRVIEIRNSPSGGWFCDDRGSR